MTIGICDYGIGGISLYRHLREKCDCDIVYFSDTGVVPYGQMPAEELRERVAKVVTFLFDEGAEYVAVACNAASTELPDDPRVAGMIRYGIETVRKENIQVVGIVGGYRTVESGVYRIPLEKCGIRVLQQPAQALSIHIEAGDIASDQLQAEVQSIFEPLRTCGSVLLACTHYPVISDRIQAAFPGMRLLDPMEHMITDLLKQWKPFAGSRTDRWITSGNAEKMSRAGKNAFGVELTNIEYQQI